MVTSDNFAKHSVFVVQMARRLVQNEELGGVGTRAGVSHAQNPPARMLQPGIQLILESGSIDGFATRAGASGVTPLQQAGYPMLCSDHTAVGPSSHRGMFFNRMHCYLSQHKAWVCVRP